MYRIYLNFVNSIPKDKILHFVVGMLLFMMFTLVFSVVGSLLFSVSVMILKEVVDWVLKDKPSLIDAVLDITVGLGGSLVVLFWLRLM